MERTLLRPGFYNMREDIFIANICVIISVYCVSDHSWGLDIFVLMVKYSKFSQLFASYRLRQ